MKKKKENNRLNKTQQGGEQPMIQNDVQHV